jgi:1-phosphatidylinositol phosphodiesterase
MTFAGGGKIAVVRVVPLLVAAVAALCGALASANGASASPRSAGACPKTGAKACLAGTIRNYTGLALTWRSRRAGENRFTAGSTSSALAGSPIRSGGTASWSLASSSANKPLALLMNYRAGARSYELSARQGTSSVGTYVACAERQAQGGPPCSAVWRVSGSGNSANSFTFGRRVRIPSVGNRCGAARLRPMEDIDCTAAAGLPPVDARKAPLGLATGMTLEFMNTGAGVVRVRVGSSECTIARRLGTCTLSALPRGAHVRLRNAGSRTAVVGVEIVGEADGPVPPVTVPSWGYGARAGTRAAAVVGESFTPCTNSWYEGNYCNGSPTDSGGANNPNWMSQLPAGTLLSQLTLPGTHDTGTWTLNSGSVGESGFQAQSMNIVTQLNAGIRLMDLRPENDGPNPTGPNCINYNDIEYSCAAPLQIYHGGQGTGLYLNQPPSSNCNSQNGNGCASVFDQITGWLAQHQNETVVLNIQDEKGNTPYFQNQIRDVLSHYSSYVYGWDWISGQSGPPSTNPPLSAIRGKMVIIAPSGTDYGQPASGIYWNVVTSGPPWGSSSPYVQDNYNCPSQSGKQKSINTQLSAAVNGNSSDLYLNFTSATSEGIGSQCNYLDGPWWYAQNLNEPTQQQISDLSGPTGRFGLIFSDFPGSNLIGTEIATNGVTPSCC